MMNTNAQLAVTSIVRKLPPIDKVHNQRTLALYINKNSDAKVV